jgi:hypothetical protein
MENLFQGITHKFGNLFFILALFKNGFENLIQNDYKIVENEIIKLYQEIHYFVKDSHLYN